MSVITETTDLPSFAPGTRHQLITHRFKGGKNSRSAYIQAGVHADEHPGLLVIQHLLERLQELDSAGQMLGEVVICPFANPVGLGQNIFGYVTGRFNLANGENFNRNFPDISPAVEELIAKNSDSAAHFTSSEVKKIFEQMLALIPAIDTVTTNKKLLLKEAFRHDIVLDLHCDTSAALHLYSTLHQQERAVLLAGCMGIDTVFLEEQAGGQPFDEAFGKPWKLLTQAGLANPQDCGFSTSIELRGQADVNDEVARADAEGILQFLAHEGLLTLTPPLAELANVEVYPLEGASHLQAPAMGLLVWKKQLGQSVSLGELIAEIVPIDAVLGTPRVPVFSDVDGKIIVQPLFKLVRTGQRVALLAGKTPLTHRKTGQLLQHF
ncbi:succinylglutamate desuccinylase [Rouxiella sp. S1S-2]|uniref:succinylglutamate desuccinylase/aspartoacylase family protein n=1 Tax=Rouxiella sp. S1S-2 TaxID=2653856 RepID=UPI001263F3DA|nr:succinylglutamate desuccinylase/aspartoacylase family protein [Rouxiella sp. S1S-2]KAB7894888.1 succinylglutamate desuccinylase [Rouxiella sp. S1S-2]